MSGLSSEESHYRALRIRMFALTWGAYAAIYMCRKNISVAKSSFAEEYGLDKVDLGYIDTTYLIAYAVGQFVSGALGDRFGGKKIVGAGLLATAICNVLFGFSFHFFLFILPWFINGFAQSTGWSGNSKLFSKWFARGERGTIMGFWMTCYQVGPIIATLLASFLLDIGMGWRSTFFVPAALVGIYGTLFLFMAKRSPQHENLDEVETYYAKIKKEPLPKVDPVSAKEEKNWDHVWIVLKSRPIWTLGISYIVLKFIRYTLMFWLPLYMVESLKYSEETAGYASSAFDIAGIFGVIFAGFVSDRIFAGRRAPICVIMMLLLAGACYMYSSGLSSAGLWPNIIGIALIGFLLYGPDSVVSGAAAVDFGDAKAAGFSAGFINGLGSVGGVLSGVVTGYVSQYYGWDAVFSIFAPMCVFGGLLLITMWKDVPASAQKTA